MYALRRKVVTAAVIAAVPVTIAAGCGGNDGSEPSSSTSTAVTAKQAASAAVKRAADGAALGKTAGDKLAAGKPPRDLPTKTVAFLNYTSQAVALRRVSKGIEDATAALGWKFDTCDAQGNPPKVGTCASTFIQRGDDVISSTAIPPALDTPQMKLAKSKGIPWLNTGGEAPRHPLYAGAFFLPEAKLYGPLNNLLISKLGSGSAEIGALKLTVDDTARARYKALTTDLAQHPNVKVAAGVEGTPSNPAAVSPAIVAMLRQHPNIRGLWSCCDILTQPIVQGVHRVGLTGDKKPLIVAPFPDQAMLQSIRDGDIFAAVDLPWEAYGWIAVDQAAEHFSRGTPFIEYGEPTQYPAALYSGHIITKDNVQQDPNKLQDPVFDYASYFKAKWKAEFGVAP
jgi:ABC-type sugar transport system substrate-binding protein